MKTSILSVAASALLLLASSATATPTAAAAAATSTCLADYIVQACLGTENGKLAACATTDYACQCAAYQAIVTCYNNCPDDPAKLTMEGQVTVFCGLATQYASSTTAAAAKTGSSSASAGALQTASATTSTSATGTGTGTAASATATETTNSNGGAELVLSARGLLAAVAGVVAAVL